MLQQTLRRQGVLCILNNTCVQQKELISYPKRLEFRRLIKYKSIFEQKFFDHFNRTPDQRGELTNWNERDPLYFDERHRNIRGGIDIVCTYIQLYIYIYIYIISILQILSIRGNITWL